MSTQPSHSDPADARHAPDVLEDARWSSSRRLTRNKGRSYKRYWLLGSLIVLIGVMFLPWQQNVQGRGELTALSPADRAQDVPSVVGGTITEWLAGEGDRVTRGQLLARIGEVKDEYLDPNTSTRYREQLDAKRSAIDAKRAKVAALRDQLEAMQRQREFSVAQADNVVTQYQAALAAAVADSAVAVDQLQRRERLAADGLSSTNDLQSSRLRAQQAIAKAIEKKNDLENAAIKSRAVISEYAEKQAKVRSDIEGTLAEVSEGTVDASKLQNTVSNLTERSARFEIRAPQDGFVVKALRAGIGEQVKAGEAVVTIQPASPRMAAAVYVKAVDVPLLTVGRRVRLQFDGWPALQFSGWPRVAVGTFGGLVAVIDRVSAPDGTFRVLVTPDTTDTPWPAELRQGSGVFAWAMLDEVRLGYELWRRVNGFPQSLKTAPSSEPAASTK
ncbi:MAG: HlyD family efflux transporter periplasmic adaptor subunit [Phycisphaerae bacterium]|nr:HlyD family efflux transporter periplasmic adaptor subunit [Gemmatimonadaceae bacterium]